mgnify:CR=1 FL=1|eukprot:scaffold32519_cov27-Tisochrysis_lutea.AAC.1
MPLDDLHALNLHSLQWTRVETPLARFGHCAVVARTPEEGDSELVIFGGLRAGPSAATFYSDTWRIIPRKPGAEGDDFSLERVRGVGEPAKRFAHCMAALGDTMYVFGGSNAAGEMADLFAGELE